MKLFKPEHNEKYITMNQWKKVLLAVSLITITLYLIALICSLLGSKIFILTFQSEHMDKIEKFLTDYKLYQCVTWLFSTIEYTILLWFILGKSPKRYYILPFYIIPVGISFLGLGLPSVVYTLIPFVFYLIVPLIELKITQKKIIAKEYIACLLRLLIAAVVSFLFQFIIYGIKTGGVTLLNQNLNLSSVIIYAIEYDIALFILLITIKVCIKEKGGASRCQIHYQAHGGSSQISMKQLQKSKWKNLSKKQRNKLRLLYTKLYITQLGGFLLVMVLPFLFGKVLEFLLMYITFAIVRAILGFKHSLHYKKETICILVGVITFGFLSLIAPLFNILIIIALVFGAFLALFLHLSYKYKSMTLFIEKATKDRYAELYVLFNGCLDEKYIRMMGNHYNLTSDEINILCDYINGEKITYLTTKYYYGKTKLNEILDEIILKLKDAE